MKPLVRSSLALLLVLGLVSCVSTMIRQDDLQSVHRGMTREDLKAQFKAEPSMTVAMDYEGAPYSADFYDMQTGTKTYTTMQFVYSQYGSYSYPVTTVVPVTEEYLFIFDEKGLVYWGFRNEIAKEEDPLIQGLAPLIDQKYMEEKAAYAERQEKQIQSTR